MIKSISRFDTVEDFWRELRNRFEKDEFYPVRGHAGQEKITTRNFGKAMINASLTRYARSPTSLRVSIPNPETGQHAVTKLDFMEQDPMAHIAYHVGHLVLPKLAHQDNHGLHVIYINQMPPQAIDALNEGVQALELT